MEWEISEQAIQARRRLRETARSLPVVNPASVRVALGASLMELRAPTVLPGRRYGGPRGVITFLSAASRRRLMRLAASVDLGTPPAFPLFVTLTYPERFPDDPSVYKAHLDTLFKRWLRRHPGAAVIWRLEFQERHAPHFHLLVYGLAYLAYQEVAEDWYTVVGSGDPDHLVAGTRVEAIQTYQGVCSYAAKYLAKLPAGQVWGNVGRWWGVHNRARLPIRRLESVLSPRQFVILHRALRRLLERRGVRLRNRTELTGLTAYISSDTALRLLASVAE